MKLIWGLVALLLLLPPAHAFSEERVIEEGVAKGWSYVISIPFEIAFPGMAILNEFRRPEEKRLFELSKSTEYYFAGIDGKTVHIYRITSEMRKAGMGFTETERLPILLPLSADETTILSVRPLWAKPFKLRLKKTVIDNGLSISLVK